MSTRGIFACGPKFGRALIDKRYVHSILNFSFREFAPTFQRDSEGLWILAADEGEDDFLVVCEWLASFERVRRLPSAIGHSTVSEGYCLYARQTLDAVQQSPVEEIALF